MKVFFDHNMSPRMVRAFRELFADRHEIVGLSDKFNKAATDVEWITALNKEGRWVVVSGDRRITRNRAEFSAFRSSNLVGFFMCKALYKSKVEKQAERILALWDNIETLSVSITGSALFELPVKGNRPRQLK